LAESAAWKRKPDAVIAFGAPRIADGNLTDWWESRSLCKKMLRVNVYNDVIHWMPFTIGSALMNNAMSCAGNLAGCFDVLKNGLDINAEEVEVAERWTHVCQNSEILVPGAMKGVNSKLEDFSPLGGVFAHFLSNALFGYGYGIVNSGLLLYDEHCGMTPEVWPSSHCVVLEDLSGIWCEGLEHDFAPQTAEDCRKSCCEDPFCEVWQWMKGDACWRGRTHTCHFDKRFSKAVLVGQRVH